MGKFIDLDGRHFGNLVVVKQIDERKNGNVQWLCKCMCGKSVVVITADLKRGSTKSCGCLVYKNSIVSRLKHGHYKTKTYSTWLSMIQRCYNSNHPHYRHYGDRGIKVCKRWRNSFENFLEDMGNKPVNLTLDRIDNNKSYCPSNCRWTTQGEQLKNTRRSIMININNQTKCLKDWCKVYNIKYSTALYRIRHGWKPEEVLNLVSRRRA